MKNDAATPCACSVDRIVAMPALLPPASNVSATTLSVVGSTVMWLPVRAAVSGHAPRSRRNADVVDSGRSPPLPYRNETSEWPAVLLLRMYHCPPLTVPVVVIPSPSQSPTTNRSDGTPKV